MLSPSLQSAAQIPRVCSALPIPPAQEEQLRLFPVLHLCWREGKGRGAAEFVGSLQQPEAFYSSLLCPAGSCSSVRVLVLPERSLRAAVLPPVSRWGLAE